MDADQDPDAFGRQTPRRLKLIIAAAVRRREREHDERIHQAWWSGVIATRSKPPQLETLTIAGQRAREQRMREPDSRKQLSAWVRAWLGAPSKE